MPRRNIEAEIQRLNEAKTLPPAPAAAMLRKALSDRVNLVVAKAAKLAGESDLRELLPDLRRAFERLMEDGAARDPQCWGKNALAKSLSDLECQDAAPFLAGMRCVQMEPVWGRMEDMAQSLRATCLLALPACPELPRERTLRHLVDGLADPASTVRREAVRALEQMGGDEPALLLRFKARAGDQDPAVVGQAFDGVLRLEGQRGVEFVKEFLGVDAREIQAEAALSLGASRMEGTVEILREALDRTRDPELREIVLRALGTSRDEGAIAFLRDVAQTGSARDAAAAREALLAAGQPPPQPV
jgi:hypothetical protein